MKKPENRIVKHVIPNGNYYAQDGYLYNHINNELVLDGRDLMPIYNAEYDEVKRKS